MLRFLLLLMFLSATAFSQSPKVYKAPKFESTWHLPSKHPDRIVLNLGQNSENSASVTWRTAFENKVGFAEIAKATAAPKFWRTAKRIKATKYELDGTDVPKAGIKSNYFSVNFTDLDPNTLYGYRVGNGEYWSEWIQFKTASDKPEKFSFLYVGDAQNFILELWSRLIRQSYKMAPNASFIIHAGDLVNHAHNEKEWTEWFEAGGWIHRTLPSISVPGNHEYRPIEEGSKNRELSIQWNPQFTLPENGPEGLKETVYYTDYQGVRIIALNTNRDIDKQLPWLENVLANNPNKWTVVTYHHPLYSASEGRNNVELRTKLKPLFDKYKVDLSLQGHDHSYARGRVSPLEENIVDGINRRDITGTVYVVSVSGGKMYNLNEGWEDFGAKRERGAENTQLFQLITVNGDKLSYESYTATGELYDAFDLIKNNEGVNLFVERKNNAIAGRRHKNTINYYDELPLDLKDKILTKYEGFKISRTEVLEKEGKLFYTIEITNGNKRVYLLANDKGEVVEDD
ncbi:MAG: 3',5'-cyclic adenosine monophosphate phosphodiesterase CpdA [Flavobacterium sp. SCGC AAA160-P02]|nr:MAG: 3',5'-cyclic adenosine monophosphate phosphodiesterase CpdA [Flavobacterium sp. SCGC AAA160-P02]